MNAPSVKPARAPRRKPAATALPPAELEAGPTDIADPLLRQEARKATIWIGITALVVLGVYLAQPLLVIFGGMVFAAAIDGGARLLGRVLPVSRGIRVTIVMLLAFAFLFGVMTYAGSVIAQQASQLPTILEAQAIRITAWLRSHGAEIDFNSVSGFAEKALGGVGQVTSALGGLLGGLGTAFLVMVLGIYLAAEPQLYRRGFAWMLPSGEREHFEGTAVRMGKTLRMLMAGRLLGMFVEGVATWIALAVFGIPMAALLGLLTGLLAFIPNIGAPISGLLMVMVGFSVDTVSGLYCIAVYFIVQTVDGNIIVPMIAKKTADLAPALVLGAQLIMGALFGILGLMLADPLVAMIKIALERRSERNGAPAEAEG